MPFPSWRPLPLRGRAALLFVFLLFACQESPPTTQEISGPQLAISESRTGGNPEFFFGSPLAENPDAGAVVPNEALMPYVRVCETWDVDDDDPHAPPPAMDDHTGCREDVTAAVTGSATGLAMTFNPDNGFYQVNLRTGVLDDAKEYRIEVWGIAFEIRDEEPTERDVLLADVFPAELEGGEPHPLAGRPRWLFGWRDINDSPDVASCTTLDPFCNINYGQTVPVKALIGQFVFCPFAENCAIQFVRSGVPTILTTDEALIDIPAQGTEFAVAFEPCTDAEEQAVDDAIALPTFGPCLKSSTPLTDEVVLTDPATVFFCDVSISPADVHPMHGSSQVEELRLHHFASEGDPAPGENINITHVEAWPQVACVNSASSEGSQRGLLAMARRAGDRVLSMFTPEPLRAWHSGGGGQGFAMDSYWKLALPGKFQFLPGEDGTGTAPVGTDVTLQAKVTDPNGDPVLNADVGWRVEASPSPPAQVPPPTVVSTDQSGISTKTVTLSTTEGHNFFHAFGHGIADDREAGCTDPTTGGDVTCNGPQGTDAEPIFDPFQPILPAADGGVLTIPTGTRLEFDIFGCEPGRGTPTRDGMLSEGEWDCALSRDFQVSLSGGSSADATVFWMNDDTHFHFAVRVAGTDRQNALRAEWDSDGDDVAGLEEGQSQLGSRALGDDVWEFVPDKDDGPGTPADKFIDEQCSGSGQSGCGENDADFASTDAGAENQTMAAFDNTQGGETVYEVSHPLATGDMCTVEGKGKDKSSTTFPCDIDGSVNPELGVFFTLSLGSGAQGDSQIPGFLEYMKVTIH